MLWFVLNLIIFFGLLIFVTTANAGNNGYITVTLIYLIMGIINMLRLNKKREKGVFDWIVYVIYIPVILIFKCTGFVVTSIFCEVLVPFFRREDVVSRTNVKTGSHVNRSVGEWKSHAEKKDIFDRASDFFGRAAEAFGAAYENASSKAESSGSKLCGEYKVYPKGAPESAVVVYLEEDDGYIYVYSNRYCHTPSSAEYRLSKMSVACDYGNSFTDYDGRVYEKV